MPKICMVYDDRTLKMLNMKSRRAVNAHGYFFLPGLRGATDTTSNVSIMRACPTLALKG